MLFLDDESACLAGYTDLTIILQISFTLLIFCVYTVWHAIMKCNKILGISDHLPRADNEVYKLIRIVEQPQEADKSAPTDDRSILSIYIIGGGRDYYLSPGEG